MILDLIFDLIESLFFGLDMLKFFNDVVAVLGFDDVADLAVLQRKSGLFEFRYHLAAREGVFAAVIF